MQKMNNEYMFESRIRFSEVDHTRKITLPGIINYFQDCSSFQAEDLGVGIDYCARHERAWVLSAWQVVVDRYPVMGERVQVSTWATKFEGVVGRRNFCMTDDSQKALAYANSVWVYMDTKKRRPSKPDTHEIELYGEGEPFPMEYAPRKIELPADLEEGEAFPVRSSQIDTNEHVNNCQYVQMALECLKDAITVRQLRAEYKKSAVYGDIIYPKTAREEGRRVTELCDEAGKPYAVVELS